MGQKGDVGPIIFAGSNVHVAPSHEVGKRDFEPIYVQATSIPI